MLCKKVGDIDEEISLLFELKEIVLDFIRQIEQSDFGNNSDIKLLYEKAKEIETQIINVDYNGNSSTVNRLFEVTEKLDNKFEPWQESHNHLFKPVIFGSPDFLYAKDGKAEWIWAIKDEVTQADTHPYEIIEYPGGLYAVAVSIDGDGESHDRVRTKTMKWLENTNFVIDNDRKLMGHMIYVDDEIKEGLGYHQMNLYTPIKL